MVAEEVERLDTKHALLRFQHNTVLIHTLKELAEERFLLSRSSAGYQNVVQVDTAERITPGDLIHKTLKGLYGIFQAVGHTDKLRQAKWSYGCFWYVLRFEVDFIGMPLQHHFFLYIFVPASRALNS